MPLSSYSFKLQMRFRWKEPHGQKMCVPINAHRSAEWREWRYFAPHLCVCQYCGPAVPLTSGL